jgi:glycosyltransferase involved in cell wall biosynthesis
MNRLGILSSHPIQYQAPWFRELAKNLDLKVFFAHQPNAVQQGEGFGKSFTWDVDLLSGYEHQFLKNIAREPATSRFTGCDTPEIRELVRQGSFDAFIVTGWHLKSYWQAVRACRKAGVPIMVRGDSQLRTPRSFLKRCAKYCAYRVLLRKFDAFLTVGKRNREYLAYYGAKRMFAVPHFVDNAWFAERSKIERAKRQELRKQWAIPEKAFCVLFCGKFISKKRPLDLVEAARLLMSDAVPSASQSLRERLHLFFVGSGELGAELRTKCEVVFDAEQAGSPPSVIRSRLPKASFAGFQNQTELPACYSAADVLVLPSDGGETWGLVANEAIACGLPVIVSDAVGCAPDLIDEGKTGFSFELGNAQQLAERISALAEMIGKCHDFSSALNVKAKAFSLEAAVAGTLEAVQSQATTLGKNP